MKNRLRAFTLVEILAVMVLVSILITTVSTLVVQVFQRAETAADQNTLEVLNDALERYKLMGGDPSVFTEGTPPISAIERLKTPLVRFGQEQVFLRPGYTVEANSIDAIGYDDFYRFTRYHTYSQQGDGQTTAPETAAKSQNAAITYLESFTPTIVTGSDSLQYEMSWGNNSSWVALAAHTPTAAGSEIFYVRNKYIDEETNQAIAGPYTLTINKAEQAAVSSVGDSISSGDSFTASTAGGSGTGGWEMSWGNSSSWESLTAYSPPSSGSYSFYIRRASDTNYNTSSAAGPYTLSVAYGYSEWLAAAQAAISSGNHLDLTQPSSSTTISIDVRTTTNGGEIWIWWDDGSYETVTGSTSASTTLSHTYSSTGTYSVVIYSDLTRLESNYSDGRTNFGGSISTMPTLTYLDVGGNNTLSGSIAGLTGLTRLVAGGSNTLTGSIAGLTGLTYLDVQGSNSISGSIAGLTSCTHLEIEGSNTVSGDISSMTQLTYLSIGGNNTVDGTVASLTNLTYLYAWGVNTLYGSLASLTNLTYLNIRGSNDISGSIAALTNLTYLYAAGDNFISGDISALTQLEYVELWSGASVSGSVTNLNNLEVLICGSAVTVTGSVAGKPIGVMNLYSNTSIDEASIVSMTGTSTQLCYIRMASGYTLSSAQVDTILENMWNNHSYTKYSGDRYIYMKYGNIEAPTATGETYITNLEGAGWSITTY